MSFTDRLSTFLGNLSSGQITLGLALVSTLMLVVEERRLSLLPLLVQYILVALMIGPRIYQPIVFVWIGLGASICLVLYLTARHVQQGLRVLPPPSREESAIWHTQPAPALRAITLASMGPVFRLVAVAAGGFVAYGLWRAYPMPGVPPELTLTSYWLMAIGLLTTLTSVDPLRMGLGLLSLVNGFEIIYLFLEQSLLVLTLCGLVGIVMALGIAASAESWLESLQEETPA